MVEPGHAVRVLWRLGRRRALGACRRQAVEVRGRQIPQRPADQPPPGLSPGQADPNLADGAEVTLDLETAGAPGLGAIGDRQLVESRRHGRTLETRPPAPNAPARGTSLGGESA